MGAGIAGSMSKKKMAKIVAIEQYLFA